MLNYGRLQAPLDDGGVLIEPEFASWPALLEAGHNLRLTGLKLAGLDAGEVRAYTRARVWHSTDKLVIACGHQPAFIHPGVWAKHVAVARAADALGAIGGDLVVDNDSPGSTDLIVPAATPDGLVAIHPLTWGDGFAQTAYEGRAPLPAEAIETNRQRLSELMGPGFVEAAMGDYLDGVAAAGHSGDGVNQHVAGRSRVDRPLGVNVHSVRVSRTFGGPFVADLLLNAKRFAAVYNQALRDYRRANRVRGQNRPLPDLGLDVDRIETPLWIYQVGRPRCRLWVESDGDALSMFADRKLAGRIGADDLARDADATLAQLSPWVVRPRALTLTLWARLLVCDLFVHGIGGAKYDRITDRIFRDYYGFEPPPLTCVSATLRLPLPKHPHAQRDRLLARWRLRDLQYNPQRYLSALPAALLERRESLIRESLRLREVRAARSDRYRVFTEIRRTNAEIVETQPEAANRMREEEAMLARQVSSHALATGREYFYALQPRQRLIELAERIRR